MVRQTMSEVSTQQPGRAFVLGAAVVSLLLVGMSLWVASTESFSRDDFGFLAFVQKPEWSWLDLYLPLEERWFWAYRPLGMESFFYLGYALFGLNAFGYFALALLVHFATGGIVFRLARQLGFGLPVATATALLSVSRHPTMDAIFYASVFHYVAAGFFGLLATSLFVDYAQRGAARSQALSCLALLLALLCNEYSITYPALFLVLSLYTDRSPSSSAHDTALVAAGARALRRVAPQLVLCGLYLYYRFRLIAPVEANASYFTDFAVGHLLANFTAQLGLFFGDTPTLVASIALVAAAALVAAQSPEGRHAIRSWLLPLNVVCAIWVVLALAPFASLPVPQVRFSTAVEVPLCLLIGSALEVAWRSLSERRRPAAEAALVLLLLAALPYHTLWQRSRTLVGLHARGLVEAIDQHYPDLAPGSRVVVLYNAPGLASFDGGARFRRNVLGGSAVLSAYFPERRLSMDLHDLWLRPLPGQCRRCVYLQLLPQLELAAPEPAFMEFRSPYHSTELEALWKP